MWSVFLYLSECWESSVGEIYRYSQRPLNKLGHFGDVVKMIEMEASRPNIESCRKFRDVEGFILQCVADAFSRHWERSGKNQTDR